MRSTTNPDGGESRKAGELQKLLARAAELSVQQGLATEDFMNAAWAAHLDANPGMRDEIIDRELRAQLKKLRRQGLLPQA